MAMGDPQKDAREAKAVRNADALEAMVDGAKGNVLDLQDLIRDLDRAMRRAKEKMATLILYDVANGDMRQSDGELLLRQSLVNR